MWTSPVRVREVWVRRRPGPLLVRFEVPELELGAAIDRGWSMSLRCERPPRCWLLVPIAPRFLPTYAMPRFNDMPAGWWFPHDPRPLIVRLPP